MKTLEIKNKQFLLDDEDYDWLKDLECWNLTGPGENYAALSTYKRHQNRIIYLHRLIMLAEYGYDAVWDGDVVVDHIDRNPLNCQKENMRLLNKQENTWNRSLRKTYSGYVGVIQVRTKRKGEPYKVYNKWHISFHGKRIKGKSFDTPKEAARAYDQLCLEERGELAVLNFPVDKNAKVNACSS